MAAPVQRPKLGRPSGASTPKGGPEPTEASSPSNTTTASASNRFPNPPLSEENKQTRDAATGSAILGTPAKQNHETSYQKWREPSSGDQSLARPTRSTRNPAPKYVDALEYSKVRPWSASKEEIRDLNLLINGGHQTRCP